MWLKHGTWDSAYYKTRQCFHPYPHHSAILYLSFLLVDSFCICSNLFQHMTWRWQIASLKWHWLWAWFILPQMSLPWSIQLWTESFQVYEMLTNCVYHIGLENRCGLFIHSVSITIDLLYLLVICVSIYHSSVHSSICPLINILFVTSLYPSFIYLPIHHSIHLLC